MKIDLKKLLVIALCMTVIASCGKDEETGQSAGPDTSQEGNKGGNDDDGDDDTPVAEDIVVTVDAEGKADSGHRFTKIDDSNFYIDDIKYTAQQGNLVVSGFNTSLNGAAKIISTLKYEGQTMKVVEIKSQAFKECRTVTSVMIPNCVNSIGEGAFWFCSGLTAVNIPTNLTILSYNLFKGCYSLKSIKIPSSVTTIGASAFGDCRSLTSITIPSNVATIDDGAFYGCSGLKSITIPGRVTSIGYDAFFGCTSLANVVIPKSVTSIGDDAFRRCTSLKHFYCYSTSVLENCESLFYESSISSATLHVPANYVDWCYMNSPWSNFEKIVAL